MTVESVVSEWQARLVADPGLSAQIGLRFNLIVRGAPSLTWHFDCHARPVEISMGPQEAAFEIEFDPQDLQDIAAGKLNPQQAYAQGRIGLRGEIDQALRLYELLGF